MGVETFTNNSFLVRQVIGPDPTLNNSPEKSIVPRRPKMTTLVNTNRRNGMRS